MRNIYAETDLFLKAVHLGTLWAIPIPHPSSWVPELAIFDPIFNTSLSFPLGILKLYFWSNIRSYSADSAQIVKQG